MSINVYWACIEKEWQRSKPPLLVAKNFYSKNMHNNTEPSMAVHKCPFFNENLVNLYEIRSIYDYSFKIINEKEIGSEYYDQDFFNDHVGVRSIPHKRFSFYQKYLFFTDKKSLEITANETPYFENNNITERCILPPAKLDIGKWFRPLEFPFYLKQQYDEFKIQSDEVMYYLRFHTKEKIIFKQFYPSEKINEYWHPQVRIARFFNSNVSNHKNFYYNIFKMKKTILKEIKKNII
jgi:hypothetical protein